MERILFALFTTQLAELDRVIKELKQYSVAESRMRFLTAPEQQSEIELDAFLAGDDAVAFFDPAEEVYSTLCSWGLSSSEAERFIDPLLQGGSLIQINLESEDQAALEEKLSDLGAVEILARARLPSIDDEKKLDNKPPFLSLSIEHPEFTHEPPSWEDLKKKQELEEAARIDQSLSPNNLEEESKWVQIKSQPVTYE